SLSHPPAINYTSDSRRNRKCFRWGVGQFISAVYGSVYHRRSHLQASTLRKPRRSASCDFALHSAFLNLCTALRLVKSLLTVCLVAQSLVMQSLVMQSLVAQSLVVRPSSFVARSP